MDVIKNMHEFTIATESVGEMIVTDDVIAKIAGIAKDLKSATERERRYLANVMTNEVNKVLKEVLKSHDDIRGYTGKRYKKGSEDGPRLEFIQGKTTTLDVVWWSAHQNANFFGIDGANLRNIQSDPKAKKAISAIEKELPAAIVKYLKSKNIPFSKVAYEGNWDGGPFCITF